MVYDEIQYNKRATFMLFFVFFVVIVGLGYIIGEIYGDYFIGVGVAALFAVISIWTSYYHSDKLVIAMTGAKKANPKIHRGYINYVEGLALAAGFAKPPKPYVIPGETINAFATGRNPDHSAVAVTEGALKKLNRAELEGVIGHEMAHIKNYDILISSASAIMVGMIVFISDMILRSTYRSSFRRNSKSGLFMIVAIVAAIAAPIGARIISLALSRRREFLADSQGVLLTRYPPGLISALEKIAADKPGIAVKEVNRGIQHLYISTPSYMKANSLFSTHPPIRKRIEKLKKL